MNRGATAASLLTALTIVAGPVLAQNVVASVLAQNVVASVLAQNVVASVLAQNVVTPVLAQNVVTPVLAQADEIPASLQPWSDWVLHDQEEARCPFLHETADRRCLWPSRLVLIADDAAGRFEQDWETARDTWVPLPGDGIRWPQDVRVDGEPALVIEREGTPSVFLPTGRHRISGHFEWDRLPEMLPVPRATGLLTLSLRGKPVPFPERDTQGRVWLEKKADAEEQKVSRLEITVHRKVSDDIPMLLVTNVRLSVSGAAREVLLGRALPPGFTPMSLESPLPARVEADNRLRAQVRPGNWNLVLTARSNGPRDQLSLSEPDGPWDAEEIWVFESRNHLRLVSIEGIDSIDPMQTDLPGSWKSLPAYALRQGETMLLQQKRRGDEDPAPDQLALQRTWWLDFNGGGYTVRDRISGSMHRSWRLDMTPPTQLGRVSIGGQDQFVTRLTEAGLAGVEVRQGSLDLEADSRWTGAANLLPSVGWDHDFHQVSAELNLPPGWRLLHAAGPDDVSPTWVTRWTLLDLFIVLITALATARLWGWPAGAVALAALALGYTEAGAPREIWLAVLATEALLRVLPAGKLSSSMRLLRFGTIAALLVITIPFLVQQVRQGVYPALERPGQLFTPDATAPAQVAEEYLGRAMRSAASADKAEVRKSRNALFYQETDPGTVVQTGPGLPAWSWNRVSLGWRGPVERDQELRLYLLPPAMNLALAIARTLLFAALLFFVLGGAKRSGRLSGPATALGTLLLLSSAVIPPSPALGAEFPSPELLEQLRARLLEPADCHPHCASVGRLRLQADPGNLRARMQVDVAEETAVPLPGRANQWSPLQVLVDENPAGGLLRTEDGRLWVRLSRGTHELLLAGPLPEIDVVQIELPLRPHHVEAVLDGWQLEGLHEDGLADASLQLTRTAATRAHAAPRLEPGSLPPFVRVQRQLQLGLTWQVQTSVERLTPAGSAIVLSIPLLPGESVTSAGVRVADGKVELNMAPSDTVARWRSSIVSSREILLQAPESLSWSEVWRLAASPIWHVQTSGIPTIHVAAGEGDARIREWRPWPGEGVKIVVDRPAGISGQTKTIDHSRLHVTPGIRATDVTLDLTMRSSRGAQHVVTLPPASVLQSVAIDGETQPIRQEKRRVTLPLHPGSQTIRLVWRQKGGMERNFTTPAVDLGAASVNAEVEVAPPADRWILRVNGPRLGPAVLFWSLLAVLLLGSLALARVPLTPLRAHQWFLLAIGLSQVPIWVALIVAGWLLALGWRRENGSNMGNPPFNLCQVTLVAWTAVALAGLFWAVRQGLLGLPEMQVAGNGSTSHLLRWYQDASESVLPQASVFTVPLLVYRFAMLAWALWLAQAVLIWLRWGWDCFSEGGLWQPMWKRSPRPS